MKLYPERVAESLKKETLPIYMVSGDEPLLVQETCDEIRAALRDQGFSERDLFHAEASFDWEDVLFSANAMSLFAEKKILEIRMPSGKPGDKGAAALKTYTDSPSEDTVMLLVLPRLDAATQRAKWFKALEEKGAFVQVWPIELDRMPRWVSDRFRRAGLQADRDAVQLMVERVEGNLLAAIQEIERLKLVADQGRVTVQHVIDGVADSSRFDVFDAIDAALSQDAKRTLKVVNGLQLEGAELLPVANLVAREIRQLVTMAAQVESGKSIDAAMQSARVWQKRKSIVGKCLRARTMRELLDAERRVARVDQVFKGIGSGEPWRELTDVLLSLAGKPAVKNAGQTLS